MEGGVGEDGGTVEKGRREKVKGRKENGEREKGRKRLMTKIEK